ncbi:MAG: hypothetical protein JWR90_2789 [Marmoricola sp.]|nr:hypothetical protein [Marmoricola sp.]
MTTGGLADRLEVGLPLLGYLVVTLTGATTSSLGIGVLRTDPSQRPGVTLGVARSIRSDEWFTQAPIELGVLSHGSPVVSPLTHGPDLINQIPSGGFFETLLFSEGNLLRLGAWLPDSMLFAAYRALPLLLVLLALPPLLRRFGATRPMSWLGVLLSVLAPATLWWSYGPIRVLGFAVTGSYLLVLARDRLARGSRLPGVVLAVLGGVGIGRLGAGYVPWGLTVGVPVAAATTAYLLADRRAWRSGLATLGLGAVTTLVLMGGAFWENRSALTSGLATVYPGMRRAGGAALSPYELFGAPGLSVMQLPNDPILSNKSEISSAFLVAGLWALVLWFHRRRDLSSTERWAPRVLAFSTVLWAAWAMVDWGWLGPEIPLMSLVLPTRSAQTVGFVAALLACVVVSQTALERRTRIGLVAGVACALVTAYGVHDLGRAFPHLSTTTVVVTAVVTGALVAAVTRWPDRSLPVVLIGLVLAAGGFAVNPVILGLGDLRDSASAHTARQLGRDLRAEHTLVAADSQSVSALLVANGVPSLTGYQVSGPVLSAWHKLDPSERYEKKWNRGVSYLQVRFDAPPGESAWVTNPNNDIIRVHADPCALSADFGVSRVISEHRLRQSCLTEVGILRWSGKLHRIYEVRPPT